MLCSALWVPRRDAQVRGNVPKVRIASSQQKERNNNIETLNPQVRSLNRQSTQRNKKSK